MKRRAFLGIGPEVEQRYIRCGNWIRATLFDDHSAREWCAKNGVAIQKSMGERIGADGAFLVPADLANAIIDTREQYGAFRRQARLVPMASDNTVVPRRTSAPTASFVGGGGAGTASQFGTDAINLTAKKIISLVLVPSELEEDSLPDIVDYITYEIAYAFASKEDDCAFNGDGTSTYGRMRGLMTVALDGQHNTAKVTASANTYGALNTADLNNLVSAVRVSALSNAAWFVSQTGLAQTFLRMVAGGNGHFYSAEVNGVMTPFYNGFPVALSPKLPLGTGSLSGQGMIAFGDMYAGAVLGQRREITIARSPERYLDSDQIGILGTERFHSVIHDVGDNTNAGSLAVLVGS